MVMAITLLSITSSSFCLDQIRPIDNCKIFIDGHLYDFWLIQQVFARNVTSKYSSGEGKKDTLYIRGSLCSTIEPILDVELNQLTGETSPNVVVDSKNL